MIYYISTSGSDNYTGLSDSSAWQTISKVNLSSFNPSDYILFKKTQTWRETLTVPSSGDASNYITFSSYGSGSNPQILGSKQATAWYEVSTNKWCSSTYFTNPYSGTNKEVFFKQLDTSVIWGVHKTYNPSYGFLTQEYDWTWDSSYIYAYAPSNPNTRYSSVEVPQRDDIINLNGKEYMEINGIDMFFATSGVNDGTYPTVNKRGFTLKNCHIAYFGTKTGAGYAVYVMYNNMKIERNTIHDCGKRAIYCFNYGSYDISSLLIQYNTLYNGHNSLIDIASGQVSGTGDIDNIIIRNNFIYDPISSNEYSDQITLKNTATQGSILSSVYIYNNIFKYSSGYSVLLQNVGESFIFNNTFYGHDQGSAVGGCFIVYDASCDHAFLKNNIFYGNGNYDINNYGANVYLTSSQTDYAVIDANYNLYYQEDNRKPVFQDDTTVYHISDWPSLISLGLEENSPLPSNPFFESSTNYHLLQNSPAKFAGVFTADVSNDYDAYPYHYPPSIGAYEYAHRIRPCVLKASNYFLLNAEGQHLIFQ
jgi:hypothetical protein